MKRAAWIALGLAAGAGAHAQTNVTIYGIVDAAFVGESGGVAGHQTKLTSGAASASRIGFRGTEALGDGMEAFFTLETGVKIDTGEVDAAGTIFNRQAWIGIGAPWGEVRVGRQYSPIYIPFKGQLDAFGAGTIASGLNNLSKITPYTDNGIAYLSPDFHGFTTTVMVALRDSGDGNGLSGDYETFAYCNGPLRVSYAHQQTHGGTTLRANLGGVSYQFSQATAYASFFNGDGGSPRYHDDGLSLSMRYAFSPRLRASLGYAYARGRSGGDNDADQFSVACEYDLSPKLTLYASGAMLRNHHDATFTLRGVNVTGLPAAYPGAPVRGVQLGMIERF